MKRDYNLTGSERKELVQVIGKAIGVKPVYMKVPTYAYKIGGITVSKEGEMIWDERTDEATIQRVVEALTEAGYHANETANFPCEVEVEATKGITADQPDEAGTYAQEDAVAAQPEEIELTVSLPISNHTGSTLRNLVNLVYTRSGLINKALGTSFAADQGLVEALAEREDLLTAEDFRGAVAAYESEHGPSLSGITLTADTISFSTLPETADPDVIRAFTELVAMMNKQAITQKRIQAKAVNEENEKYALRIWLTRLGMNGPEHKTTRKILMENLSGHSAFRTEADKQRWNQRQAEKYEAAKVEEACAE